MIDLIIAHVVQYSQLYLYLMSVGCAGTAGWMVRRRPGDKEDPS